MGRVGKHKTLVNISLPNAWREEIDRRAETLDLTRASYTTFIIRQWWVAGCPPINDPDRLMQVAKKALKKN